MASFSGPAEFLFPLVHIPEAYRQVDYPASILLVVVYIHRRQISPSYLLKRRVQVPKIVW